MTRWRKRTDAEQARDVDARILRECEVIARIVARAPGDRTPGEVWHLDAVMGACPTCRALPLTPCVSTRGLRGVVPLHKPRESAANRAARIRAFQTKPETVGLKVCTCTGSCRGFDRLGPGWRCALRIVEGKAP